jgi:predicted MPP superfamily phosphohydrolase
MADYSLAGRTRRGRWPTRLGWSRSGSRPGRSASATRKPTHRIVHFTDVHHKGDRAYLQGVVKKINALSPDFVCFTGDLIEETQAPG